jgi:hypothetical protein
MAAWSMRVMATPWRRVGRRPGPAGTRRRAEARPSRRRFSSAHERRDVVERACGTHQRGITKIYGRDNMKLRGVNVARRRSGYPAEPRNGEYSALRNARRPGYHSDGGGDGSVDAAAWRSSPGLKEAPASSSTPTLRRREESARSHDRVSHPPDQRSSTAGKAQWGSSTATHWGKGAAIFRTENSRPTGDDWKSSDLLHRDGRYFKNNAR